MAGHDPRQPGRFPPASTSARAEVLAVMLASEDMAGIESMSMPVVGLTPVIRSLMRKYHWPIDQMHFPTNTGDGRASWTTVYCLHQEVIDAALDAGGRDWIAGVKAARAAMTARTVRRCFPHWRG